MERPAGLTSAALQRLCIAIIIIFHCVGLAGFTSPQFYPLMLRLVPFHLYLMVLVTLVLMAPYKARGVAAAAFVFIAGYLLEVAGVHTGKIFGLYHYGPTLGLKLWQVPLTMGINWVVLMFATTGIAGSIKANLLSRCIITGLLMVLLDGCIEPVAIKLHFWHWHNNTIPPQNYIAWFFFSALLAWPLLCRQIYLPFKAAITMYLVQGVFFASLWLLLA